MQRAESARPSRALSGYHPRVMTPAPQPPTLRERLYIIIFEHDTKAGRTFDEMLLVAVLASVLAVILESVQRVRTYAGSFLLGAEWFFTVLFSIEYVLRIYAARGRRAYVLSFFGVVDLVALLPTYVSLSVPGAQSLLVVRVLRLLRVFRILKLARFGGEADALLEAIKKSLPKVTVFLFSVLSVVIVMGSVMYFVEGPENGYENIPVGMYWAIVTVTTVGFGDITPHTAPGRVVASLLMTLGYGLIAVPTGILSAELTRGMQKGKQADGEASGSTFNDVTGQVTPSLSSADADSSADGHSSADADSSSADGHAAAVASTPGRCAGCGATRHAPDALFCRICGFSLAAPATPGGRQ